MQWLDYQGFFASWNDRIFDFLLTHRPVKPDEFYSAGIFTVGIDDSAYRNCFGSGSPLDPRRVSNLVKTIAALEPAVIGVDIRTEGAEYRSELPQLTSLKPSIVWTAAFENARTEAPSFGQWLGGAEDRTTVTPLPVLGMLPGQLPETPQTNWGIPLYPREQDSAVRRFPSFVEISSNPSGRKQRLPSFSRKIADAYCPKCAMEPAPEVYVSYAGKMPREFDVSDLLTCSASGVFSANGHSWGVLERVIKETPVSSIVLVGGTFRESRDFYATPVGELPGLTVNAYAVKAELEGNGLVGVSQPWAWLIDLAMAAVILFVCDPQTMKTLFGPGSKLATLDLSPWSGPIRGIERKKLWISVLLVLAACGFSLLVAKGRYLLGLGGEGFAVVFDRARDAWITSREERQPHRAGKHG